MGAIPHFFLISSVGDVTAFECAKFSVPLATGGKPCACELFCGFPSPYLPPSPSYLVGSL